MSEKDYAKSIIELISKHILEKYHKAFEELAK